jgi:hypothetical protein
VPLLKIDGAAKAAAGEIRQGQLQEKEVNHIKDEPTFELPESPGAIIIARVSSLQRFSDGAASSSGPILARPGQN